MTHQRLEEPRYGYSRCDVATRIPTLGHISTLDKRPMYRLPNYTAIEPRYGDWKSNAMASHIVVDTDTAPEEEDDRKPPAPEKDLNRKGPALDNGDADC